MIIYITGGVRSGKSRFAQELALKLSPSPAYIATAIVWDDEFKKRIERHQQERGAAWMNIEAYRDIVQLPVQGKVVVIDCVTLWLTNYFMEYEQDIECCLEEFKKEVDEIKACNGTFIIISNEIGMGLHADTALGRKFTDLQGWANQHIATYADEAIFMVSGLPLYLKKTER